MSWRVASTETEIGRNSNSPNITMAYLPIQATALPRLMLPQLSRSTRTIRPAALGALEARRHRSSPTFGQCAPSPITTALQQRTTRQWRTGSPCFAAGCTSILDTCRHFSATAPQLRDHHFDTLKFVQRLREEGFSEEQAEGMMKILGDVIEERYVVSVIPDAVH
jgi:hypothetical protein